MKAKKDMTLLLRNLEVGEGQVTKVVKEPEKHGRGKDQRG